MYTSAVSQCRPAREHPSIQASTHRNIGTSKEGGSEGWGTVVVVRTE